MDVSIVQVSLSRVQPHHFFEANVPDERNVKILRKLCVVANDVIKDGSGIGFTSPFADPASEDSQLFKFFSSVAEDPQKILLVALHPKTGQPQASLTLQHNTANPRGGKVTQIYHTPPPRHSNSFQQQQRRSATAAS